MKKTPIPTSISPMLATPIKEPIANENYVHEVKFDGYRIIAYKHKDKVRLSSRGGNDYTEKYPTVVANLKKIKADVVLDGEVCVLDDQGIPDFDALQKLNERGGDTVYYCFDVLWLNREELMSLPLLKRKARLKKLLKNNDVIRFSEHFDDGVALFDQVKQMGFEGIVSKKRDSIYKPGIRGTDWYKTATKLRQEFVIGGYAESDRGRNFRSILFGAYNNNGQLEWVGRSGGGYKERDMPAILQKLKVLEIKKSPFINSVLDTKGAIIHYVKPKLVANFEFSGFTKSGRIRKPATWLGFREDKDPSDVVREIPKEAPGAPINKSNAKKEKKFHYLNNNSGWEKVDKEQGGAEWTDFNMAHCTIPVHNLERELWEGVPKRQLLFYYSQISDYILPYIKDRPQSLNLKLTHAGSARVFIKDMENRQPKCATVFTDRRRVAKPDKRSQIDYLIINNLETLIYATDLGCIDINPWASRIQAPEYPDYIWVDLDPSIPEGLKGKDLIKTEDKGFAKSIDVALACRKVLDKYKLRAFIKTSGKTGLHIYIPCTGFKFEATRTIAYHLADAAHKLVPEISTRQESKNLRGDKVYIDAGQNDYADTLAAPYCIRPYHAPLVSTPIQWGELKKGVDRWAFNIDTIQDRLSKKGDLFEGVLNQKNCEENTRILQKFFS